VNVNAPVSLLERENLNICLCDEEEECHPWWIEDASESVIMTSGGIDVEMEVERRSSRFRVFATAV
jgi:hypothetical protein